MAQRRLSTCQPCFVAVLLCAIALDPTRARADDPVPTQVAVCMACHGNGMKKPEDPAVPMIAGQQYEYLLQALTAYREGERSGQQAQGMREITRGMSIADLAIAAQFYTSLRAVRW
jgi:cytochrome c553